MSGGVPKRIQISRTQQNTYCKAGGKDKVQGLVLCSGARSRRAMCNYVMKRTAPKSDQVYINGGVISRDGDYIIHSFTTPGTHIFSIDIEGSDYVGYELEFDTLVVGGGGGGGGANADARSDVPPPSVVPSASAAGGGGGGDFIETSDNKIIIHNGMKYQVIVGDGGVGGIAGTVFGAHVAHPGDPGGNSSFFGYPASGGVGGEQGDNGIFDQFGVGGDATAGSGGNHSSLTFRYGGGGGGGGYGEAGTDASFNEVTNDASGGMGGFFAADGISTITGTSLMYGGGGGGGVAWFNELTHSVVKGLGGGVGGDGGFYITNPSAAPDNSFNPVGYDPGTGTGDYGYSVPGGWGSVADLSLNILGTDYTIDTMLWDGAAGNNHFALCLRSTTLQDNSFNSISFVSNVPGSVAHTYYTDDASFTSPAPYKCWTWTPAQSGFTNDATYWTDASGTNLDIFLNINDDTSKNNPTNGIRGGGGGGATSSDIQNSAGDAAIQPQLPTAGGNGGDGIVIIRYKDPNKKKRCADGLTK
ncbi:MAG: hypothetical protein CXT73_04335 [Methanobacteriota archaeon]|nr:MAG: hypothetical protein CXT73_04335 [Euryarchaeota archaeon]